MCWQDKIFQTLKRLNSADPSSRLAVMGIGHELRGDDAAGILLARKLCQSIPMNERLLIIDAGAVPENFCGSLRNFSPKLVLVTDAAQMGLAPGAVSWLELEKVAEVGVSTHAPSLLILAKYLRRELGCQMALLGIEPAEMSLDAPLSPRMKEAVQKVNSFLSDLLLDFSESKLDLVASWRYRSEVMESNAVWKVEHIPQTKEANPI